MRKGEVKNFTIFTDYENPLGINFIINTYSGVIALTGVFNA
jgi:hypothetical protein